MTVLLPKPSTDLLPILRNQMLFKELNDLNNDTRAETNTYLTIIHKHNMTIIIQSVTTGGICYSQSS